VNNQAHPPKPAEATAIALADDPLDIRSHQWPDSGHFNSLSELARRLQKARVAVNSPAPSGNLVVEGLLMIESLIGTHTDWVVAIARIVLGIIFFGHGAQKMLGWYDGPGLSSSMRTFTEHLHLPSTLAFLVIAGEFFSGVGLIVGLFSRIAAFVIVLTMVGAIATVHFRFGLFLNWFGSQEGHGIEYHLLAIALALVVVVKGAGAFSLDRLVYEHISGLDQSATGEVTMTTKNP
jgi:putative oxidoreductase